MTPPIGHRSRCQVFRLDTKGLLQNKRRIRHSRRAGEGPAIVPLRTQGFPELHSHFIPRLLLRIL